MKTIFFLLLITALAGTLAGCSEENPFEVENATFSGSYETTFQFIPLEFGPDGQPTRASVPVQGTGQADYLDQSTVELDQVLDFTIVPPTGRATVTFTAEDGATLLAETEAFFTAPDANGRFTYTGSMTITGGTGRFSEASGTAEISGTVDQSNGTGTFSFDGMITF